MSLQIREAPVALSVPPTVSGAPLPRVLYSLVLDPDKKFGSLEEQLVLLAQRFQNENGLFLPLFICDPSADVSQFRERGVETFCLDLRCFSWGNLLALRRLIRAQRIDLLHWNFTSPLTNPYVWALSLLTPRLQHWFTDHNSRLFPLPPPPRGVTKLVKRLLLRRYRRVLCVSRYVQDCLEEQQVWSNLVCASHFINTDRFRADAAARRQLRATLNVEDRFVLLVIGQLITEKGVHVAIRALSDLPPQVVLWIAGTGPEEDALRQLISELKLKERVRLLGLQTHVQPYLQAADCVVFPSLWGEAAGLVNLEAQACGTTVVGSRIGGVPEYVVDGQTGLLFPAGDHHALAQCVRRLVEDTKLRLRLARQARVHALEQFSPDVRLSEWVELYRRWRERP
jgi:glycosyltransferase involved in cell wall biosynthesis